MPFAYDEQGRPYSMTFNGTTYFYVLNLQGDVISLVDASGAVKATYTYDAWGNAVVSSGALVNVNPLRYRGYYYDFQTQMYYLNSRYFDPANRRFISADEFSNTDITGILSTNTFAYCENNPVTRGDHEGKFFNTVVGALVGGVIGGITAALESEDIATGIISGGSSGAIAGFGVDVALTVVGTGPVGIIAAVSAAAFTGAAASLVSDAISQGNDFELSRNTAAKATASAALNVLTAGLGAGLNKALGEAFNHSGRLIDIGRTMIKSGADATIKIAKNVVSFGLNTFVSTHTTVIGRLTTRIIGQMIA